jgi:FK506-binding nuclear protein
VKKFENGFEIHSTKMGDPHGKLAKSGKKVSVKYVGRLKNGKVFDKTDKKPFQFRLGECKGQEVCWPCVQLC